MKEKKGLSMFRFIVGSLLGIFLFFIKIPIGGAMTLPVDWVTGVVNSLLADYNLRHGKFMPFHIGLEGLSLFCGIVFFLCNLFAIYHKGVHRVCLSCGR